MEQQKRKGGTEADVVLIAPYCPEAGKTARLKAILEYSLEGYSREEITTVSELEAADLKDRRVLFAISLGKSGINLTWYTIASGFAGRGCWRCHPGWQLRILYEIRREEHGLYHQPGGMHLSGKTIGGGHQNAA